MAGQAAPYNPCNNDCLPSLTLTRPDDWHLHLRDGAAMAVGRRRNRARLRARNRHAEPASRRSRPSTARRAYRDRIVAALPPDSRFAPLMTLYLTDNTSAGRNRAAPRRRASSTRVKYYPAGATTNSDSGVTDARRAPIRRSRRWRSAGCVLSLHGEVTDPDVDVFDRERVFVERALARIVRDFPALQDRRSSTSRRAKPRQFVAAAPAQRRRDDHAAAPAVVAQRALRRRRAAALLLPADPEARSASRRRSSTRRRRAIPKFFLGTDSAPHARHAKESACGGAGCYSAPLALAALCRSVRGRRRARPARRLREPSGADFYGLPRNADTVTLERASLDGAGRVSVRRRHASCRCAPARRCAGASPT